MMGVSNVVIISGNSMPNLRRVGHIRLLCVLLGSFVVVFIGVFVMKGGTDNLNIASQAICSETVWLVRVLWERSKL